MPVVLFFRARLVDHTNRMFTQIRRINENVFERISEVIEMVSSSGVLLSERISMKANLRKNITPIARISQVIYDEAWSFRFVPFRNILENSMMLHPRSSVVRVVAREWIRYWDSKIRANNRAPAFPKK